MPFPANKTKIVCTIGPASDSPEVLERMIRAGMNIARLNFSHGDFKSHAGTIQKIRAAAKAAEKQVAIMADLPGPKMRIGELEEEPIELAADDLFTLTTEDITDPNSGWLAVGGANNPAATDGNPFLIGDANLDGFVDGLDFIEWNTNKFTTVAAWCSGDFNADGFVDGLDFIAWNANKFTSSSGQSAVPEPGAAQLLLWLIPMLAYRRCALGNFPTRCLAMSE